MSSKATNGVVHMEPVAPNGNAHTKHHHIWLVTGPAGCGKSTVAKYVADCLSLPYIEGDEVSQSLHISLFLGV